MWSGLVRMLQHWPQSHTILKVLSGQQVRKSPKRNLLISPESWRAGGAHARSNTDLSPRELASTENELLIVLIR